jgi:acyl-coenzyme A synthetase/AMP-(fatty) acid ligase
MGGASPVPEALTERVRQILALDPAAPAMEFERQWSTWGDIAGTASLLAPVVEPGERVALLLRNRPAHVGLLVGLLSAGACVVTVNPGRGIERVRSDLAGLGVGTVAGTLEDLEALSPGIDRVRWITSERLGSVQVSERAGDVDSAYAESACAPGVAVEMLTSGTTGPPKRIPLTYETMWRVLVGAKHYESAKQTELRLRSGVAVINAPLVHLGGLFRVVQCVADGRLFCLLERFRLDDWVDAVRRHRPHTVSLVPTALRMVLDADLDPADLASIKSVVSGTAPLSPEDADAFFTKYGVPVLVTYAATEFGGGVAGWNLADHQRYWAAKRGSVGRAHAGCELRIVDPGSGEPVPPDTPGVLEVKARQLGDALAWNRTTDLASIDADGFVWILGRADQAIIRGGFKVLPDDVRAALERDPRVRGAAVIGVDDPRLGAVPVAAVELRSGKDPVTSEQLLAEASNVLARYELPTRLQIVAELPRTPSGKVDLPAVREMLAEGG